MKKILITGSTGFIGKNLVDTMQTKYDIYAPSREELDLFDELMVYKYLQKNRFDVIIHAGNVNTTKIKNVTQYNSLDGNLRMFTNIEKCSGLFDKMLYFGSGAEYNKSRDIKMVREEQLGNSIPIDPYGFSKYCMSKISANSNKIYELILFGVYGKYEEYMRRFISNNICNNLLGQKLTIKQNLFFDYLYIDDLVNIVDWFINNTPRYNCYNVCRGEKISLLSLAKIINHVMDTQTEIVISNKGMGNEYTGCNSRLLNEIDNLYFTSFESSIEKMVCFYRNELQEDRIKWIV